MATHPGRSVTHYRLIEKIGEGGTGIVYRAEDRNLRRQVALKFLPNADGRNEALRRRLLEEARSAARINHPNICIVHEVHESDDESFIAMELVEGETLHDLLRRPARLPLAMLLDIATQLAEGLAAAHALRVVHRDLKPQNVMVTPFGRVKILDFGLARALRAAPEQDVMLSDAATVSSELPEPGGIVGTIAYLSPEQALGKEVDARSDIFSFGTMLYEMLTGTRPFAGEGTTATVAKILESTPEPPRHRNGEVPEGLQQIVLKCLAKNPQERYDDTRALAADLAGVRRNLSGHHADAASVRDRCPGGLCAISATTIAVFPFSYRGGDSYAYLGEGMVDLLSTKMDGAGELRCVDAHAILGSATRDVDTTLTPDRAAGIAQKFGAGLYILGNILEAGGELHVDASLYDLAHPEAPVSKGAVRGGAPGIFNLVDELSAQILASRCGGPGYRLTRVAALSTGSFPALKAYLEGETQMRRLQRTAAAEAFQRAVDEDPKFALAWYRLSVAALWSGRPQIARRAAAEAERHRDRLSERDGHLLAAFQAVLRGANDEAERLYETIVGTYPDDVEAWYQCAELLFHFGPLRGRPLAASKEIWERVLYLDPRHANALTHLAAIAANGGDRKRLDELSRDVAELSPDSDAALWTRTLVAFSGTDDDARKDVVAALRRASDHALTWAVRFVGAYLGDLRSALEIAALLVEPVRSAGVRALGRVTRAHLEVALGRWSAARAELGSADSRRDPAVVICRALLAATPFIKVTRAELETARSELDRWDVETPPSGAAAGTWLTLHEGLHLHLRAYLLGVLNARLRDTPAAERHAAEIESLAAPAEAEGLVHDLALSVRVQVDLAEGRPEAALDRLRKLRMEARFDLTFSSPFLSQGAERYALAELLQRTGHPDAARVWFGSFGENSIYDLVYLAPAHLRLAEIDEQSGSTARALDHYTRFVALWGGCDPELQPAVDNARRRITALS